MEYVILRILKEDGRHEIITTGPLLAQQLIDDGIAERYIRKQHGNNIKNSSDSGADLSG